MALGLMIVFGAASFLFGIGVGIDMCLPTLRRAERALRACGYHDPSALLETGEFDDDVEDGR